MWRQTPGSYRENNATTSKDAKKERGPYPEWLRLDLAAMAADAGNLDALALLVDRIGATASSGRSVRATVLAMIPATGTDAQIQAWLGQNRKRLTYQKDSRQFVVQPNP